ncbi:P-loop containing nucleoside triphosphate hydrolase protein, partial [Parathielavia hyrcaniae]
MAESLFSTEARRIGFRRVSREWHAFCMFDSVVQEGGEEGGDWAARPSRLVDMTRQAAAEEDRRWKKMRQVDIGAELRRMLGPEARFRGVQEAALRAIMRQESPIVVVMGTGGGKSMLFMLPAACAAGAGGLTVVVVPLVSLRGDIKDRCDALGIECVEWSGRRPHEWASIVLVTPEAAVSESFGHFINRQRAMGRLDRIVVDECHVVLDSGAGGGWRSRMLGLRGLVKAETQLVYLTATLRPADEAEFGRLVGL